VSSSNQTHGPVWAGGGFLEGEPIKDRSCSAIVFFYESLSLPWKVSSPLRLVSATAKRKAREGLGGVLMNWPCAAAATRRQGRIRNRAGRSIDGNSRSLRLLSSMDGIKKGDRSCRRLARGRICDHAESARDRRSGCNRDKGSGGGAQR